MRIVVLFLFLSIFSLPLSGSDKVKPVRLKYINDHKEYAIKEMQLYGIPASITLAQACLESMDGRSDLATKANNHFGIKCSNWNGPGFIQDDDTKDECFRKYNSIIESYTDHSEFLKTRPRYEHLFNLDKTDYKGWAKGLKKAGYATDPSYADRLIKIIEDYELHQYDLHTPGQPVASLKDEPVGAAKQQKKTVYVSAAKTIDAFESRKIYVNNGIDYIIVKKGDNLKSLAKEFELGYWQIPKYNELDNNAELMEGQIIYLKPKKNTGSVDVYIVKPGDTIKSIAQDKGIKSKYIYKYNNLPERAEVEPGQQIALKKSK
jgi:LysM repeat protein